LMVSMIVIFDDEVRRVRTDIGDLDKHHESCRIT
jgi:hypothetical protein